MHITKDLYKMTSGHRRFGSRMCYFDQQVFDQLFLLIKEFIDNSRDDHHREQRPEIVEYNRYSLDLGNLSETGEVLARVIQERCFPKHRFKYSPTGYSITYEHHKTEDKIFIVSYAIKYGAKNGYKFKHVFYRYYKLTRDQDLMLKLEK